MDFDAADGSKTNTNKNEKKPPLVLTPNPMIFSGQGNRFKEISNIEVTAAEIFEAITKKNADKKGAHTKAAT